MGYKVLSSLETNPSASNVDNATIVAVTVTGTQTVTMKNSDGDTIGTISLPAGIHKIVKKSTDTITVTGYVTKIAHTE